LTGTPGSKFGPILAFFVMLPAFCSEV
jgi:hypothetical protein